MEGFVLIKKIPHGTKGISETVAAVLAYSHEPETTSEIREIALYIIQKSGAKTELQKAKAIHDWVKSHIRYEKDPTFREFVQQPLWLIKKGFEGSHMASGDCDDHCAVNMALMSSIGFGTRAVVTEDPSSPGPKDSPYWAHIYCDVHVRASPESPRKWVAVDSSMWFLEFGKKVGGRSTTIYPHDIPIDIFFDAGNGRQGLGYVAEAIRLGTPFVDNVMKKRTKGGKSIFNFTVNGVSQSINGLGLFNPASFVTGTISAATGFVSNIINTRSQKQVISKQIELQKLQIAANERLQTKAQELEFQSRQLDKERENLLKSEELAFDRLRSATQSDKFTSAALVGLPLLAILGYNIYQGFKEGNNE